MKVCFLLIVCNDTRLLKQISNELTADKGSTWTGDIPIDAAVAVALIRTDTMGGATIIFVSTELK